MSNDSDIVTRLTWQDHDFREEARQEIVRLRSQLHQVRMERDEARRSICALDADILEDQIEYAKHRGWGYLFEEDGK
jgi:hypothetical protein